MMSVSENFLLPPIEPACPATVSPGASSPVEKLRIANDLLQHLPADCESSAGANAPVVALHRLTGIRVASLYQLSNSLDAGPESIFLTIFSTLLARLAGQEMVILRNISGDPTLLTLRFEADASFRTMLKATPSQRRPADQPAAVEYTFSAADSLFPNLPPHGLSMAVHCSATECDVQLGSSTGLWSQATLQLWLRYFDRLLGAVIAEPDAPWKTLPLLDPAEAQAFYRNLNQTAETGAEGLCIHELVMRQVTRAPLAVAVVSGSQSLSYAQLDQRSNAIAHRLQALGAGPNRPVLVCLDRTAELPVALLGVLKAGSCYVPLDPQDARPRLRAILDQCRPVAIIADSAFSLPREIEPIPVISPNDDASGHDPEQDIEHQAPPANSGHQAYVIYTSGTTGKPKGVPILHRALVNFITSATRAPGFTSADRMLAVAPISFDIAAMDMFLPLVSGGTLFIADRHTAADPYRLATLLRELDVTVLQATPATWRLLASSDWEGKRDLKMISGGEALPRDLANQLLPHGKELWNCYGPTETTIYSSVLQIQSRSGVVPLGPPIANTTFYVLDDHGRLLPPGVPGELYIGGTGVSPGYLEPPQNSLRRFLHDPYAGTPGALMFRSGDLVRLLNGDRFEFFGRLDHQVKLRGYRIELGEIEFALRTFPGIQNAVAALHESGPGEPYLIAYVTARDQQLDQETDQPQNLRRLRDHVSLVLPAYMVPSRFVLMESIPLTTSGKIDRKALFASGSIALSAYHQPEGVTPRTSLEQKLLTIFREVLATPEFGVTDSFFDYGGYSLLTVKLFTRINRALDLRLPISLVFDAPTVRSLAEAINRPQIVPPIVVIRSRGKSVPLFVVHSYLLYGVLRQIVEDDRPVYGVREQSEDLPVKSVEEHAASYVKEILSICPDGPLLLTGWCAAGSLTLEIARQLRKLSHKVGLVALLDAERPGYRPLVRGNRTAAVLARVGFHMRRLRSTSIREKLQYFGVFLLHLWDTLLERVFVRQRPFMLRLQRLFGAILPRAVFDNAWSRIAAIQNYAPMNYPGKVVLFRAADDPGLPGGDETMGWNEIVDGGVEVVFVPGDHESMFHQPNVDFLRRRFRQALQLGGSN